MIEKRRPIAERIAELMGKTSYRDIRDGIGGGFSPSLPIVAAQLGVIQRERGKSVVMAMETYYGSTLMHERCLRQAWDAHCRQTIANIDYETAVLSRMGCALAIRQLAGVDYGAGALAEYAWIIRTRREVLQTAVLLAEDWLDELWNLGVRDLRSAFRPQAA